MESVYDNYPAQKYVDEYEKDNSEECKACKGNCSYIGMTGDWACKGFIPKDAGPRTNADRIRSMTDEELAEWLDHHVSCSRCPLYEKCISYKTCSANLQAWLEEGVVDGV